MLAAVGTAGFFEHGRQLYGEPTAPLRYLPVTPLQLAHTVQETIAQLAQIHFDIAPPAYHSAAEVAEDLKRAVSEHFGDQAPSVDLVDQLSANALATSKAIRMRRDARFTDRDYVQLLNHEAHIHVATSINGKAQTELPILADGHPGTTRTQEGLAVFAELISGSIELDRLRRLADRVFTIQMAIDGADFLDVYRYYLEQTGQPGSVLRERAPGLPWRAHHGRRPLHQGRGLSDRPALGELLHPGLLRRRAGRCDTAPVLRQARSHSPSRPCASSMRWACAARRASCRPGSATPATCSRPLTFSGFANRQDLDPLVHVATKLLDSAPVVRMPTPGSD